MSCRTPSRTLLAAAMLVALHAPSASADASVSPGAARAFEQALAADYQALAKAEALQGDARDAGTYAERAAAANAGRPTAPEEIMLREPYLKDRYVAELNAAQERLRGALVGPARLDSPVAAARAQTSFECWLEQAAEDLQPGDVDACRQSFLVAMNTVESTPAAVAAVTMVPEVQAAVTAAPAARTYRVFFAHDSAALLPDAMTLLTQVDHDLDDSAQRLKVVGHSSSIGARAHNQALSERRATAVKDALVAMSVDTGSISTEGRGENDQLVATADGVAEPRNRQVLITVEP